MSNYVIVIPARHASTRLPGKPLLDIAGKSMIQRVWERSRGAAAAAVLIATDDRRIADHARGFGADVAMTDPAHPSGTDRLEEVARQRGWDDARIVVNVQGDEPLIPAAVIDQVAGNAAADEGVAAATLAEVLTDPRRLFDPNVVKVVRDANHRALYFSRAPIPYARDHFPQTALRDRLPDGAQWLRHIGIYAYRVGVLHRYVHWPRHSLEAMESLEQLRILGMGERIHVDLACAPVPAGVDTPDDLARVRALFAADSTARAAADGT